MKKHNQKTAAVLMSLGLGMVSFSVDAIQAGDLFARGTSTSVNPNDDSSAFSNVNSITPGVTDNTTLGATLVYMVNDNIGLEILAALPFEHNITVGGASVGSAEQLPPTFSLQYYISSSSVFRPYVGAGINYTIFFSEEMDAAVGVGTDLSLDNSFGLAVQVGFDYDIDRQWFVNADIRYISIETTATNSVLGASNVDINPTVFSVGLGYKF